MPRQKTIKPLTFQRTLVEQAFAELKAKPPEVLTEDGFIREYATELDELSTRGHPDDEIIKFFAGKGLLTEEQGKALFAKHRRSRAASKTAERAAQERKPPKPAGAKERKEEEKGGS